MKRARHQKGIITCGIATVFVALISYGLMRYTQAVIACAPVTVVDDALLAPAYAEQLAQELSAGIHRWGPQQVVKSSADYSTVISDINIHYTVPLHGIAQYQLKIPLLTLNQIAVALPDGTIVPSHLFDTDFCATLPAIQVPHWVLNDTTVPAPLKTFAASVSSDLLARFKCEWCDSHTCIYRDTQNPHYSFVYEGDQMPQSDDIAWYDAARKQHKSEKVRTRWLVDLRFKNQVVVSPDGGV